MKRIHLLVLLSALALPLAAASARGSGSGSLVLAEVYAAGGNSGAAYANDYVELFNRGASPVAVDGWTLQYASASSTSWQSTALSGTIPAGGRYLVQLASGGANGAALPAADATGTSNLAATGGKVALVDDATALSCGASAGSCSSGLRRRGSRRLRRRRRLRGNRCGAGGQRDQRHGACGRRLHGHGRQRRRLRDRGSRSARTPRRRRPPARSTPPPNGASGSAGVDVDIQPVLSIALDHPTLSFPAAVPGTIPAPQPEQVTVTSNDASGYTLSVHRTAFTPHDLPLGIGVGSGSLAAVPIAPAPDLPLAGTNGPSAERRRHGGDERRVRLAAAGRGGRALHGDADLHGDRQVRRALAALVLAAAAASIPGAAAGRGIGLSASPLRLTLRGASASAVTVRNPSRRTLRVDVSRAGFTRSLRGKPRVRPARGAVTWLRLHPRRFRLAPGAKTTLHVAAVPRAAGRSRRSPGARPPDDAAARREARPGAAPGRRRRRSSASEAGS